jgi:hypothetical protein
VPIGCASLGTRFVAASSNTYDSIVSIGLETESFNVRALFAFDLPKIEVDRCAVHSNG